MHRIRFAMTSLANAARIGALVLTLFGALSLLLLSIVAVPGSGEVAADTSTRQGFR